MPAAWESLYLTKYKTITVESIHTTILWTPQSIQELFHHSAPNYIEYQRMGSVIIKCYMQASIIDVARLLFILSLFKSNTEQGLCGLQTKELFNALLHFTIGVKELDGVNKTLEHLISRAGGRINILIAPRVEVWKVLLCAGLKCLSISCCSLKAV